MTMLRNLNIQKHWTDYLIAIVFILQLVVFSLQLYIFNKQTQILERSSPPYEPWLEIIPDYEDLTIHAEEIIWVNNLKVRPEYAWAEIDLTFYNFGKMDSQRIHCDPGKGENPIVTYMTYYNKEEEKFEDINYIENIPGQNSVKVVLHVRSLDCQIEEKENCKAELIPLGKQDIILSCTCEGCKEYKSFNEAIPICIYYEDKTAECPENWM